MEEKLINMILDDATTDGEKINAIDKLKRRLRSKNLKLGIGNDSSEYEIIAERQMREIVYLRNLMESNQGFYKIQIKGLQQEVAEESRNNKELQLEITNLKKDMEQMEEDHHRKNARMTVLLVISMIVCCALGAKIFTLY